MHELEPIVAQPAVRIPRQVEDRTETTVRFAPLGGILSGPIFTRNIGPLRVKFGADLTAHLPIPARFQPARGRLKE